MNLGYFVFAEHRGNGYATRAVELLLQHLARDTEYTAGTQLIDPENEASLAVAGQCGFHETGRRARRAVLLPAYQPMTGGTGPSACQHQAVDETTEGQLRVIRRVIAVMQAAGISAWLFGGWGLDARIGRITRKHGDVEFWVERINAERSKALLVAAGATALATQPPAEACEFTWADVPFSTAYFDRQPDGSSVQLLGRWSDWLFPPGSFGDEPGTLDGTPVLAMSVSGMLAMKEQYPHLRNGRPWRQKDIADIEALRALAAKDGVDGQTRVT